ncbi:MAG: hypothetical protein A3E19_02535 [Planctomycetes bacterium RIFCSPHIGHO2_12_FULL_52_36]|nr:MAG: hypothetical protein A3E19_02535 [Planctomycetes bacterium RIFCSPHIGHO2_12_FULL_52_36]
MKKDYIYHDKGQYRLLQNAKRLGNFMVADKGFVPIEQVLPEQRFAHQPIFRRPPEELVTVFSYIHNFNQGVFSSTNRAIKVANLFKKSSTTNPDGVHLLYKYTGWTDAPYVQNILLKNWSAEAQATKYWSSDSCRGYWTALGNSQEGVILKSSNFPIFFKNYIFFSVSNNMDAIYYAKLNSKRTETKEIKVAIQENDRRFYSLGWLYMDATDPDYGYKLVIYKQNGPYEPARRWSGTFEHGFGSGNIEPFDTGWLDGAGTYWDYFMGTTKITAYAGCGGTWILERPLGIWIIAPLNEQTTSGLNYSINMVQYKANSLEGPWVYDKTWDTYNLDWGSPAYTAIIQELASLIFSKNHKDLSIAIAGSSATGIFEDVLREAYTPPYTNVSNWSVVYSRGGEGEIIRMWPPVEGKNYLVKRQGNGQMEKTLITDIDNGYKD